LDACAKLADPVRKKRLSGLKAYPLRRQVLKQRAENVLLRHDASSAANQHFADLLVTGGKSALPTSSTQIDEIEKTFASRFGYGSWISLDGGRLE
jgi:hypothetical protein